MQRSSPGFPRSELKARYDVSTIEEDEWHSLGDERRKAIIRQIVRNVDSVRSWLLNAGAGAYSVSLDEWNEVAVDFFATPLFGRKLAVCANIEALPFSSGQFGMAACIGEVLSYCDPARAIGELARVLAPNGTLLCDFGSTRSARYWFTPTYGRAAELVVVDYNGGQERVWVYDPSYIFGILRDVGFEVLNAIPIYKWAAVFQRVGAAPKVCARADRLFRRFPFPKVFADVLLIEAKRVGNAI